MDINIHIDDTLVASTKRQLRKPMVVIVLGAAVLATVASASPLGSVPNAFEAGAVISASEMNENFEAVVTAIDAVDAEVTSVSAAVDGLDEAVADLAEWRTIGFKITPAGTVSTQDEHAVAGRTSQRAGGLGRPTRTPSFGQHIDSTDSRDTPSRSVRDTARNSMRSCESGTSSAASSFRQR